jgi:hypothetical protein
MDKQEQQKTGMLLLFTALIVSSFMTYLIAVEQNVAQAEMRRPEGPRYSFGGLSISSGICGHTECR